MHNEGNTHILPSHFDLPDWSEIKTIAGGVFAPNPAVTVGVLSTIGTKRGIEKATGQKLTTAEVDKLKTELAGGASKAFGESFTVMLTRLKWIILGLIVLVLFIKLK